MILGSLFLRRLVEHRFRTALAITGIAIGSALLVAVLGLFGSLTGSITESIDQIAGNADIEVGAISDEGFDESLFFQVDRASGVEGAVPIVRGGARFESIDVMVLGVDERAERLETQI